MRSGRYDDGVCGDVEIVIDPHPSLPPSGEGVRSVCVFNVLPFGGGVGGGYE